jgi:hypothetical protein
LIDIFAMPKGLTGGCLFGVIAWNERPLDTSAKAYRTGLRDAATGAMIMPPDRGMHGMPNITAPLARARAFCAAYHLRMRPSPPRRRMMVGD